MMTVWSWSNHEVDNTQCPSTSTNTKAWMHGPMPALLPNMQGCAQAQLNSFIRTDSSAM